VSILDTIAGGVFAVGSGIAVLAQATSVLPDDVSGPTGAITGTSAVCALCWIVFKYLPALHQNSRDDRAAAFAVLEKQQEANRQAQADQHEANRKAVAEQQEANRQAIAEDRALDREERRADRAELAELRKSINCQRPG
jgi:hypothetical protein